MLFFFLLIPCISSVEKIWILRHCDKPENPKNPCCSEYGKIRFQSWNQYFMRQNIPQENSIQIIGSNYDDSKSKCVVSNQQKTNEKCNYSQRMVESSLYLQESMMMYFPNVGLDTTTFCSTQTTKLALSIYQNHTKNHHVILVWSHTEIIDLLRTMGISIKKWKRHLRKEYNIVFLFDVKQKTLSYDCFQFDGDLKNQNLCNSKTSEWLQDFARITPILAQKTNPTNNNWYNKMIDFGIAISIGGGSIGILLCIYQKHRNIRKNRYRQIY